MNPLPTAHDVEAAMLSVLLSSDEDRMEEIEFLKSDHFSLRSNRLLFDTIKAMRDGGNQVDLITLTSKLRDLGLLEEIGGSHSIGKLAILPPPSSLKQCVSILEEKHKLRKIINLGSSITMAANGAVEACDIIKTIESTIFSLHETGASQSLTGPASYEVLETLEAKKRGERVTGLKTNIYPWDEMLGGLVKARFYVLAARAGRGKTAMIEQIITQMLVNQNPVLIFEKDMSAAMLISRMACRIAEVPFTRFDLGNCNPEEYDQIKSAITFLKDSPLHVYSPSNLTISDFRAIVKREKRRNGVRAVFLDHVLNLDVGREMREGLTHASSQIRESVQESELPHIILAQLNREADKCARPQPSHIKEFDALYADCDVMAMLWSEEQVSELTPGQPMTVKFTVNKNRYGSEFEDELFFNRSLMKFNLKK